MLNRIKTYTEFLFEAFGYNENASILAKKIYTESKIAEIEVIRNGISNKNFTLHIDNISFNVTVIFTNTKNSGVFVNTFKKTDSSVSVTVQIKIGANCKTDCQHEALHIMELYLSKQKPVAWDFGAKVYKLRESYKSDPLAMSILNAIYRTLPQESRAKVQEISQYVKDKDPNDILEALKIIRNHNFFTELNEIIKIHPKSVMNRIKDSNFTLDLSEALSVYGDDNVESYLKFVRRSALKLKSKLEKIASEYSSDDYTTEDFDGPINFHLLHESIESFTTSMTKRDPNFFHKVKDNPDFVMLEPNQVIKYPFPDGQPHKCETNTFLFCKQRGPSMYPVGGFIFENDFPIEHWWVYDSTLEQYLDVTPLQGPENITGYCGIVRKDLWNEIDAAKIVWDVDFFKGGNVYSWYFK